MLSSRVANPPQIVEMTDEENTAVVTEPESETGNINEFGLTQMFESEQEASSEQEPSESLTEEEESEELDEDVLSQSNEEEEVDEDGEPVPKSVQKLLRQVNKLTARAKSAEEQLDTIQQQKLASGQTNQSLNDIHTLEDLEKFKDTASKAKKFALKNLGKDYVEYNGEEYDQERISSLLEEADEALTNAIPNRKKHIEQREGIRRSMTQMFPWVEDEDNAVNQAYQYGRNLPELSMIHQMPNGDVVFALMAEGYASRQARQQAMQKAKGKTKKASPPKQVTNTTAPPKGQAKDKSLPASGNIDLKTFSQYLEKEEE